MSFETDAATVVNALNEYYQRSLSGELPVIAQPAMGELIEDLRLSSLIHSGNLEGEALAHFLNTYLSALTRIYHPANIAHQQAVPHYMAALAGLIDHFVSSDGSIYELGPASVSIEFFLINWFLEKVGWKPQPVYNLEPVDGRMHGGGILTHGGSIANLTALIAARTKIAPEIWQQGNPDHFALLAPAGAHYSIARSVGIMGMGQRCIYPLQTDRDGVILPDQLEQAYEKACVDGKQILAVIANAGTTALGLYDPLLEIGAFCRKHSLWLHVDGAHGGPALLTSKYRHLMRGIEQADSFTFNAHKMMRVTAVCTVLLVRDARHLDQAFTQEASYLFHEKEQPGYDFLHRTIECTKPVLGLKLFMVLAGMGEAGMAAYIERQFDLAAEAYEYLQGLPDFECPARPQSNILCFRVINAPLGQLALRERLLARGHYYVSSAMVNGERYLRLTLTNPATTMNDLEGLVHEVRTLLDQVTKTDA